MSVITLFHFARERGHLPKGDTEADQVKRPKQRGGHIGYFKPTELAQLLSAAEAEIALYVALGAFTGIRSAELLRLDWGDINFDRQHITVGADKAKTATRRLVPIAPNLQTGLRHTADRVVEFFGARKLRPGRLLLRRNLASRGRIMY